MPQIASPFCTINDLNISTALKYVRRIARCSPCNIRAITTTRSLPAAQNGDDKCTEERTDTENIDRDGLSIRRVDPHAQRNSGRRKGKPLNIRCAELLSRDRYTAGSPSFTVFKNQPVTVRGVIKTIRKQKKGAFADFTDGSCFQHIQVVLDPELAEP